MPVKTFRPLTPSTRYITISDYSDITKKKPEKSLVVIRKKTGGRNTHGRVTARGIGGGHKQKIRPGMISIAWIGRPTGTFLSRTQLPTSGGAVGPDTIFAPTFRPTGATM